MDFTCHTYKSTLKMFNPILHKEASRMEGTLDFDSLNIGANF